MERDIEKYIRISEILGIFQAYSLVEPAKLKKAQDTGTAIHAAIESFYKDEFIPLDHKRTPYFESFLKWADSFHPRPIAQETRLYDDSLMLTGQFDLLADIDTEKFLIDFKTGSWAHPEIWNLQMHWYRHLMEVNELWKPEHFMIVQLKKDGSDPSIFHFTYSHDTLKTCFYALECYRYFKIGVVVN